MLRSQIGNLTSDLSFSHNLCLQYPNGSCEPISNIYIPRAFQWYNENFNSMSFDPWNCFLKIQESIRTPTPKMGAHLGVWGFIPSHFRTLLGTWNVTPGLHSWFAPLQALPCFGREPKVKVMIGMILPMTCTTQTSTQVMIRFNALLVWLYFVQPIIYVFKICLKLTLE